MNLSRRSLLLGAAGSGLALSLAACGQREATRQAARLVVGLDPEPTALTSAASIDPGTLQVSNKIFDRLFTTDANGRQQPQLALSATPSADGLSITLALRPGVLWHDGQPFESDDVAYSLLNIWKVHHARGFMSYANVVGVDTPDPLTAVIRLNKPAPYILSSLADGEAQVAPKHLYEGRDVLTNPANLQPVGTGPFRFVRWERGSYVLLQKNPAYWDSGKPHLDEIYFRFLKDSGAAIAALETGAIQYISGGNTPLADIERLKANPAINIQVNDPAFAPTMVGFGFNLDRPLFKDLRVRHAIAHGIDRDFILQNIWNGYGVLSDSPIPPSFGDFHNPDVPRYPFDPARAEALLDDAGYKRGPDGVRLRFTLDPKAPNPLIERAAQFLKASLAKIGVEVTLRSQDLGQYLDRVFTRRDFDAILYTTGYDVDPALGIQRFYWSKTFQPGVPFSNATHYGTPEVDRLLESAQVEIDPARRRNLYFEVQRAVQRDLPIIPILFPKSIVLTSSKLKDSALFRADNFANAVLSA